MGNFWYWWECFKAKRAGRKDGKYYGKANTRPWEEARDEQGELIRDEEGKIKLI